MHVFILAPGINTYDLFQRVLGGEILINVVRELEMRSFLILSLKLSVEYYYQDKDTGEKVV